MLPSDAQYLQECPNAASPATFRTYDADLVQNTTICMDFEGNLHSRELESEIGLTFDTDLQDPEIFCFENSDFFFFVAKTHVWSQMGIRSMITYFWYVPKGYRKQHFHSLIAILKIGILIELFHNPWNPYYSRVACWRPITKVHTRTSEEPARIPRLFWTQPLHRQVCSISRKILFL